MTTHPETPQSDLDSIPATPKKKSGIQRFFIYLFEVVGVIISSLW